MDEKKQIEEMVKIAEEVSESVGFDCPHTRCPYPRSAITCEGCAIIEAFRKENYRKQSVGEWVKVMNHKECSKCGYNAPYKKIKAGYHLQDLANFCPNCGAKMKGGA